MTLDPNFSENHYVYVFATTSIDEQRIVRLTEVDGVGTDLTVIRDNLPTTGQVHNGGSLRFGPDGFLYFGIGDTGTPELSRQMHTYAGKICRIAADGSTPDDNPFATPTGTPRAVYALGFRNPFRACFAPDGRLFVMDVGSNGDARREEINLITAGANYGWPDVEGIGDPADFPEYTNPVLAYHDEGSSIAGCGAVLAGNNAWHASEKS
jgi:glucose/arabinose dehydrogenase